MLREEAFITHTKWKGTVHLDNTHRYGYTFLQVRVLLRRSMMRITSKGQVTIPIDIREKMGLQPYTEVVFQVIDGKAYIEKNKSSSKSDLILKMRGKATVKMTTDEIMRLTRG
jgi:AbrB family looped-hinge helix DNA binding protein